MWFQIIRALMWEFNIKFWRANEFVRSRWFLDLQVFELHEFYCSDVYVTFSQKGFARYFVKAFRGTQL